MTRDVATRIRALASERILVLDGAWGVLLQSRGLTEADFRGERFAGHPRDLLNDPDLLNLTQPDIVRSVHESYFAAGADLLLIETVFDPLSCKAAIVAAREAAPQLPLWISVTIVDLSGRTLTGQTIEAFWTSIEHADPLIVGVNCSLGAREMRPYVADLARIATCLTSAHPNAGLPNAFGGFDETPEITSALLHEFARDGFLNIAGSCCGSTPEHTKAIAEAVRGLSLRSVP